MRNEIEDHVKQNEGYDRRDFLKCMAWAGTGLAFAMSGGILSSCKMEDAAPKGVLSFIQISDTHIGFNCPRIRMSLKRCKQPLTRSML